jgi:serine/threonine protein kinase
VARKQALLSMQGDKPLSAEVEEAAPDEPICFDAAANDMPAPLAHGWLPGLNVTLTKVIGEGSYGKVYMANIIGTDVCYAAKLAVATDTLQDLGLEHDFLMKLRHPNVVQCFGYITCQGQVGLMMELAIANLWRWLGAAENALTLDEPQPHLLRGTNTRHGRWQLLLQVSAGLSYIHACSILHCDIKTNNCLVFCNGAVAKVADLGLAVRIGSDGVFDGIGDQLFTPHYRAPECICAGKAQAGLGPNNCFR